MTGSTSAQRYTTPTSGRGDRDGRWQYLVAAAFQLDEVNESSAIADARAVLDGVLEVFPPSVDPIDDFEGFAVRRMAKSLLRALGASSGR